MAKSQSNAPRIERATTKLWVPYENKSIAFAHSSFGPGTYQQVGKAILGAGLTLPTGDYTASLVHPAYCSKLKGEPEFNDIREKMESNWLWVFNTPLWTDKGVYVVQDEKAQGISRKLSVNQLERMLRHGKEVHGLRFSEDGRVRFAPKESYKLGEHTPESLAKDGFVIVSYDFEGAEKLGEVSEKLPNKPMTWGVEVNEGEKPELRVSALVANYYGRLHVYGLYHVDSCYCHAFGVL